MATTAAPTPAQPEDKQWFALASDVVAQELGTDEHFGLAPAEASTRLGRYGPNAFVAAETEPRWHAFVRQYRDPMQIVLLVAGIGSIWPLHELGTGLVLLFLTLFNAVLGLNQEGKAAAAVAALQKMMIVKAKVRRGGQLIEVPAEQLVPGDVVAIEAGDVVPADGRLLKAATLEVAESALTGESMPVAKGIETVTQADAPLGDRTDMVYMNTNVTRGRRRADRHHDRDVDRGRPHLQHAVPAERVGLAADEAADQADEPDPRHLRDGARHLDRAQPVARRVLRHRVPRGHRVRHRRHPHRSACGGDRDPLDGDADAREGERHHEAAALDRDARLHVGHQLRQDRDADPQPDDRGRNDAPRPPLHDRRHRLLHGGPDHEGRGSGGRRPRAVHAAAGARLRRRGPRRRADRGPDRGRPRRARRERRARGRRDAGDLSAGRRAAVRHRVQVDGHVPQHARRVRQRTSSAASSRELPTRCSPARRTRSRPTTST